MGNTYQIHQVVAWEGRGLESACELRPVRFDEVKIEWR